MKKRRNTGRETSLTEEEEKLEQQLTEEHLVNKSIDSYLKKHYEDLARKVDYWMTKHEQDLDAKSKHVHDIKVAAGHMLV